MPDKSNKTTPKVVSGVNQPDSINPSLAKNLSKKQKKKRTAAEFVAGIRKGNRVILSQAITLIESTQVSHQQLAQEIIEKCLPFADQSIRIGITGTPGVGKSSFIEKIGNHLIEQKHRLAVLAIDPTSQVSRGSILGDKTRMTKLAANDQAFIRPSAAGKSLGGVARKTRETIILCEAAGYDTVFVETVGVGQSEIAVHSMVDFFLLLLLPGAGDELQGIKRGIVEMADLVAVNKADDKRLKLAKQARQEYRNALHLFPPKESQWVTQAVICSALSGMGIVEIWDIIMKYKVVVSQNGYFNKRREQQAKYWFYESIQTKLQTLFFENQEVKSQLQTIEQAVLSAKISPFHAAEQLIQLFKQSGKNER